MKKLVFVLITTLAVCRSEFCTDHDCDTPDSEADSSKSNEDQDMDGESRSTQDSPQNWDVFSTIQNTVSNAWGTVKNTVHKKTEKYTESVYNTTAEYAEKVRYIFREELTNFLAYFLWESSAVTDPAFEQYQHLQKALWHWIIVIELIIICLLFSYIFWQLYLGILFILAFNCSVLILYKVLGSELVHQLFWKGGEYAKYFLSYVFSHPYISAAVIVVIFGGSIYWTLKRWHIEYSRVEREERMETAIVSINTRLQKIEEQQEEMLHLLRKLQSAKT